MEKFPVKTIATHFWTHFDEYVAIILATEWGEAQFPGIGEAGVSFYDAGAVTPDYIMAAGGWRELNILPIGVWDSPFNEHSSTERGRRFGQSATSLMVKYLRLEESPRVAALSRYVTDIDQRGGAQPGSVPSVVKLLNSLHPTHPFKVFEWAKEAILIWLSSEVEGVDFSLDAIAQLMPEGKRREAWLDMGRTAIEEGNLLFQFAIESIKRDKWQSTVPGPKGRKLKLIVMESDNFQTSKAMLGWAHADIAVVKKSTGHVQIMLSNGLRATDLARVLNVMEQREEGELRVINFRELSHEGTIEGGRWHYVDGMEAMLNGSLSAPNVPSTRLSLQQIVEAIETAFDPKNFSTAEQGFACDGTTCKSTLRRPCPWYAYGLGRCQSIRFEQHRQRSGGGSQMKRA